jgi:lipopolysaccharide/colanic/teichoic acid biosynthesis glycosyltransferase
MFKLINVLRCGAVGRVLKPQPKRCPVFKVHNVPRITAICRFLRRYSIDELPRLWNVLAGDMSLVESRPLPVYEVKNFEDASQRRRLSVQPGITGLWQVNGRNKVCNFED